MMTRKECIYTILTCIVLWIFIIVFCAVDVPLYWKVCGVLIIIAAVVLFLNYRKGVRRQEWFTSNFPDIIASLTFIVLWIFIIVFCAVDVPLYWKVCGVLIIIAAVVLFLNYRKGVRRQEWFASHSPEIIASGRRRAAERARAVLQEEFLLDAFVEEFKGSRQDPEIDRIMGLLGDLIDDVPWKENEERELRDLIEKQIRRLQEGH
jgi:membrane protein implicated in regulation of membrane protease activity